MVGTVNGSPGTLNAHDYDAPMDRYAMHLLGSQGGHGVLATATMFMATAAGVDDPSGDASKRLSMAILGLLMLAGLILVATIAFWRMTRPERSDAASPMRSVEPVAAAGPSAEPVEPFPTAVSPAAPTNGSGSGPEAVAG